MELDIPTHHYIKGWILHPGQPQNFVVAQSIANLVSSESLDRMRQVYGVSYKTHVTIPITRGLPDRKEFSTVFLSGSHIIVKGSLMPQWMNTFHPAYIDKFNATVGTIVRKSLLEKMKTYLEFHPSIKKAAEYALEKNNIDEDHYSMDNLIKMFQRDREKNGGITIYKTAL